MRSARERKPYNIPAKRRYHDRGAYENIQIEKLTLDSLVNNYLCCGENSMCVLLKKCECLDVCKYGQRYIELTQKG